MYRYTVLLTPESDGSAYNVTVPALPGCFTFGATIEEALTNAREAIKVHIEGFVVEGEPIPEEPVAPQLTVMIASVDVDIDVSDLQDASQGRPAVVAAPAI
jgi:antitoxin HicB